MSASNWIGLALAVSYFGFVLVCAIYDEKRRDFTRLRPRQVLGMSALVWTIATLFFSK